VLPEDYDIEDYFKQTKWVMILNKGIYNEYLYTKLKPLLEANLSLVNKHGDPNLLTLKDEDILQLVLEIIYSKCTLSDLSISNLCLDRLQASRNQEIMLTVL